MRLGTRQALLVGAAEQSAPLPMPPSYLSVSQKSLKQSGSSHGGRSGRWS